MHEWLVIGVSVNEIYKYTSSVRCDELATAWDVPFQVKEAHMKSHDVVVRNISGTQQSNMSVPSQTNARKSLLTINRSGINQTKRAEDVSPVAPVANLAPEMETSVCTTDVSTKTNILPTSISGGSKPVPMVSELRTRIGSQGNARKLLLTIKRCDINQTKRTEDASPVPPVATSVPKIETPVCSTAVSTKTNIFMTSVSGGSKSAPMVSQLRTRIDSRSISTLSFLPSLLPYLFLRASTSLRTSPSLSLRLSLPISPSLLPYLSLPTSPSLPTSTSTPPSLFLPDVRILNIV